MQRTTQFLKAFLSSRAGVPLLLIAVVALCLCMSCSKSSRSTVTPTADALTMPDRIEISNVEDDTATSIFNAYAGYDDAGTDYTNQTKQTWVKDTDALSMVNQILGVVKDTGYESFVNAGSYKALIKPVGDSETSQGGNSATSTTVETLQEICVEVTRASNNDPMIVKIWVIEENGPGGSQMVIRGHFTVTEGVSTEYPLGEMVAHFKGQKLDSNGDEVAGVPLFTMAMQVGADSNNNVTVQFIDVGEEENQGSTFQWSNKARVITNADMTEGNAYIYIAETNFNTQQLDETTSYFAFNSDYFKFQDVGSSSATVLDKSDLSHRIFRYKLFNSSTGAKITNSSGFPIQLATGEYGYIGYYGMWVPYGVVVETGDTFTRVDTNTQYTLVKVRGKLTEHTRQQTTLEDLTDMEISVWDNGSDIIVAWNGSGFFKIGTRDNSTGQITYLQTPTAYSFSNDWDGGWCEALSAFLRLGGLTPANSDIVYYHAEQTVSPASATDMSLYCWEFCLDAPITQTVIDNASTNMGTYYGGTPTEKTYFFDATNLVLKEDETNGEQVIIPSTVDLSSSMYQHGYHMGPLTTDSEYTQYNCWDIYDSSTYYYWATGPNEWNQFSSAQDSNGNMVAFSPPIRLTYTHTTDNDINADATYNGDNFNMDYDGTELHIPWKYDDNTDMWSPIINLKDGVEVTLASDGVTTYVVKGIEEELIMNEETDSATLTGLETTLPIDNTIAAPDLTYDATKTAQVGAIPTSAQLKVIKGELVTDS